MVYIDENGDAAGNYTILQKRKIQNATRNAFGLVPIGTFINPEDEMLSVSKIVFIVIQNYLPCNFNFFFLKIKYQPAVLSGKSIAIQYIIFT